MFDFLDDLKTLGGAFACSHKSFYVRIDALRPHVGFHSTASLSLLFNVDAAECSRYLEDAIARLSFVHHNLRTMPTTAPELGEILSGGNFEGRDVTHLLLSSLAVETPPAPCGGENFEVLTNATEVLPSATEVDQSRKERLARRKSSNRVSASRSNMARKQKNDNLKLWLRQWHAVETRLTDRKIELERENVELREMIGHRARSKSKR